MWSLYRLQAHGICSCRLVYKEVVVAQTIRKLTCGDSEILLVVNRLGVDRLKKTQLYTFGTCLKEGRRKEWYDDDLVFVEHL